MTRTTTQTILLTATLGCLTACGGAEDPRGGDFPSVTSSPKGEDPGEGGTTTGEYGDESTGDDADGSTGEVDVDHTDAIDQYIYDLGYLSVTPIAAEHAIPCDPNLMECPAPWQEGEQTCELQYYEQTEHVDTFIALQPDAPALWPGALVRGLDASQGFLSTIGLERSPATFSLSLETLNDSPVATMQTPSLSAFRDARNQILQGGLGGATPAQVSYDIKSVASRSELSIHIGASVDWVSVIDFDAMFDFDSGEFSNRYLLDFTQTYYTADLDAPARPSGLFTEDVQVADLEPHTGVGDPPMYVQSVVYGRRVLFAIESNDDLSSIVAAVDAAFGGIAELEADVEATNTLESAKITAGILGGDAEAAVKTILGVEELVEYLTAGGNYSADSPGAPIAYRLAYLDNAAGRLALTAQFAKTQCQ